MNDGKITKRDVDRIRRMEVAHANTLENFPVFFGTVVICASLLISDLSL